MNKIRLTVNDKEYVLEIKPYESLLLTLRNHLGLKSCKRGCDYGGCGACTVIVDNLAIYSCMTPAQKVEGSRITTVEGLQSKGRLHPLQDSFNGNWAVQCGYCSPGIILSAKALLDKKQTPTESEVREALVGNLCTCTGYVKIIEAILDVAQRHDREKTNSK